MTKFMPFVYDTDGFTTNQKCFIITGECIAFLTAFFNSSLFKYCFRDSFPELQGGTREMSKIFFDKIPVVLVNQTVDDEFRVLVEQIQVRWDKETAIRIDQKIFDLYGLTKDEQDVIGFIEIQ